MSAASRSGSASPSLAATTSPSMSGTDAKRQPASSASLLLPSKRAMAAQLGTTNVQSGANASTRGSPVISSATPSGNRNVAKRYGTGAAGTSVVTLVSAMRESAGRAAM